MRFCISDAEPSLSLRTHAQSLRKYPVASPSTPDCCILSRKLEELANSFTFWMSSASCSRITSFGLFYAAQQILSLKTGLLTGRQRVIVTHFPLGEVCDFVNNEKVGHGFGFPSVAEDIVLLCGECCLNKT